MEGIKEAWDIVFGEGVFEETLTKLFIILGAMFAVLLLILIIAIWKSIAGHKIKKSILALSEHPNDKQSELFFKTVNRVSFIGRFFNKHSRGFSGLSKGECRSIYNSTILTSESVSIDNKKNVRAYLIKLGCKGLTDI